MSEFGFNFDELKPLREKKQSEYIPSEEEILEYAEYLGVNLPEEDYMLELVREGITAQLPPDWQACHTPDNELLYRNLVTKKVQQDHPLDEIYRQRVIQLRRAYEEYEEDNPQLTAITEERSEEHSLEIGEDEEIPSRQFFESHQVLRPQQSSDLNRAVIYSSQRFSEPKISANLNILGQDSLSKERQKSGQGILIKSEEREVASLKKQLQDLLKQEKYSAQLLQQIRANNEEKMKKLKRRMGRKKK